MLEDIQKKLWSTADKLRANMDAAEYKHIVLGLIFLKYISDAFEMRRQELNKRFMDSSDVTLESALIWLKLEIATVFSTCLTLEMDSLLYALLIT